MQRTRSLILLIIRCSIKRFLKKKIKHLIFRRRFLKTLSFIFNVLDQVPFLDRIDQIEKSSVTTAPSSNLWFTSENATATTHYDLEHNFFWQLYGKKVFRLSMLMRHDRYLPHCSFHPEWRQAQRKGQGHGQGKGKEIEDGDDSGHQYDYEIELDEGDLLYLPPMMFHSVRRFVFHFSLIMKFHLIFLDFINFIHFSFGIEICMLNILL